MKSVEEKWTSGEKNREKNANEVHILHKSRATTNRCISLFTFFLKCQKYDKCRSQFPKTQ